MNTDFDFRVLSLEKFIERIRNFSSQHPEALPQRSNLGLRDALRPYRDENRKQYRGLKTCFMNDHLFMDKPNKPGLYFFFDLQNGQPRFYYIGISGTKANQTQALRERLDKHLLVKDFVFYALAFPEHAQTYFGDVVRFYVQGKYPTKIRQYRREFDGIDHAPPNHLAWVACDDYSYTDRDAIETHFIREFDPPANHEKKTAVPPPLYKDKFEAVRGFLHDHIGELSEES